MSWIIWTNHRVYYRYRHLESGQTHSLFILDVKAESCVDRCPLSCSCSLLVDTNHPLAMEKGSKLFKRVFHRSSASRSTATASTAQDDTSTDTAAVTGGSTLVADIAHFANYGVTGDRDPNVRRVKASDWTVKVFAKPKTVPWSMNVSKDDIAKLIRGFEPNQMEEKWFVYSEDVYENRRVSGLKVIMVRSWTGIRMFELDVVLSDETDESGVPVSAKVVKLTYETHKKSVDGADEDWAKSESQEVCSWVLGVTLQ